MKRTIILSVFTLLVFGSCQRNSTVELRLNHAEELMSEHPDSAWHILESIDRKALDSRRIRARHALLSSQALDKNYIDVNNDSLICIAIDYYANHGSYEDRAKTYYYHAIVQGNASNTEAAIKALVMAEEYAKKTKNSLLNGLIFSYLGDQYYSQYSFDGAIAAYSSAIPFFETIKNKTYLLYVLWRKGVSLNLADNPQQAIECLSEAQTIAVDLGDRPAILDIIASIGGIKIDRNDDITSLQTYKQDIFDIYNRYADGEIPVEHYPLIGYIYWQEGQIDSARILCNRYYSLQPHITSLNVGVLSILSQVEESDGNYKKALFYERLYSNYSDSLNMEWRNNLVQNLERKYRTEYFQKSYAALKKTSRYAMVSLILVIAIIIILAAVVIASYKRAIYRKNQELSEYEHYIRESKTHYAELTHEYNEIKRNLTIPNEHSQTLFVILENRIKSLQKLLELASICETNPDNFYRQFKEHLKVASGKNQELANDVIAIANLSCHGIIDYLQKSYPALSQRELCYCGFICLGFSPESIRILYNHTNTYSIYTLRSKIRSKLGITNDSSNLEKYIVELKKYLGKTTDLV